MKNPPDFPSHLPPLPEPPAGHKWVYRGTNWKAEGVRYIYLPTSGGDWSMPPSYKSSTGAADGHYAEAVKIESPDDILYFDVAYRKAVLEAALRGEPCQYWDYNRRCWKDEKSWRDVAASISNQAKVRIKPLPAEPRMVPLEASDIPPVCWLNAPSNLRYCVDGGVFVIGVGKTTVGILDSKGKKHSPSYERLMREGWEYSADRKTWTPCSKEAK